MRKADRIRALEADLAAAQAEVERLRAHVCPLPVQSCCTCAMGYITVSCPVHQPAPPFTVWTPQVAAGAAGGGFQVMLNAAAANPAPFTWQAPVTANGCAGGALTSVLTICQ